MNETMDDVRWAVYGWLFPTIQDARQLMDRIMNTPPPAGTRSSERPFMSWFRFEVCGEHVVALCTSPLQARYRALVQHLVGDACVVALPPEYVAYCRDRTIRSAARGERKYRLIKNEGCDGPI